MPTSLKINLVLIFVFVTTMTFAKTKQVQFSDLDSLSNITKLVEQIFLKSSWVNDTSFVFSVRNANIEYFRANVVLNTKSSIDKAQFDSLLTKTNKPNSRRSQLQNNLNKNKWEAYLFESNIWIKNNETDEKQQLSFDGTEADQYVSYNWSPNYEKLVGIKEIQHPTRKIPLIESSAANQNHAILHWIDYNKPGDTLAIKRPTLFDIATGAKIEIACSTYENQFDLWFGKWYDDSSAFTFEFNQRGHQLYQLVRVDANTGLTNVIAEEKSNTFIEYNKLYRYYTVDNKYIVWSSERDNWRHLYLIDAQNGEILKQLTDGNWVVREVIKINEEERTILFAGSGKNIGEDPYNIHIYKLHVESGYIIDLTPENANHEVKFSPDFEQFIDTYSRPDLAPVTVIRNANNGNVSMELAKADISKLLKTKWTLPEPFVAKGRDGITDIWGTIYRPSNFNPKKKYPIVEYIYAGPHDSFVEKNFRAYMGFSKLLEMGFIVVSIDGMGTGNRSKAFHDICWQNLKDSGFEDRILWMKAAAAKYKYMDTNRVGIYGYSAGGQSALSALLHYNDFYKVAVSLCGCHDNRVDKIWWNEQWMGYPIGEAYSTSSNVDNAYKLKGKLLLINGELDKNVDPISTLQVVNALVKADKDFEQLYLPGYGHNLGDNYITRRAFNFFVDNL